MATEQLRIGVLGENTSHLISCKSWEGKQEFSDPFSVTESLADPSVACTSTEDSKIENGHHT